MKHLLIPAGLRDALVAFLMRELTMEKAEEPVTMLRNLPEAKIASQEPKPTGGDEPA